jgi:hypothetical protein
MDILHEEWRAVVGFEGKHEVSNHGRVRSVPRDIIRSDGSPLHIRGGLLTPSVDRDGYAFVCLSGRQARTIHTLVAKAFLGARPDGMQVNHKDGVKSNNHPSNLEYVTPRENTQHAIQLGLSDPARRKLNESLVREVHARRAAGETYKAIGAKVGASGHCVRHVIKGRTWKHVLAD